MFALEILMQIVKILVKGLQMNPILLKQLTEQI